LARRRGSTRVTGPEPLKTPKTRQKRVARGSGKQGCMYHIWAPECQIQLRRGQQSNYSDGLGASAQRSIELPDPVG
jgi:hypothetical protein